MNDNKLTELPSEIGDFKELKTLKVSGNPFVQEAKTKGMTGTFMIVGVGIIVNKVLE